MGQPLPQHIADKVAEQIEQLIVDSVLKPGQLLPSERNLCDRLQVSRSVLREGLRILRGRGIIDTHQGKGSYVADLTQHNQTPLMHLFSAQPRTLYDLLEVRALLEGESARLAAVRGTQADLVLITRRYEEMLKAHAAPEGLSSQEHARLDHSFHLAICEASHNPVLVHTLRSLTDLMLSSVFAAVNNLYHRPEQLHVLDKHHSKLYRAILQRQPQAAEKAARTHILDISERLKELENEEQRLVRATLRLEGW
ncbi:transcriptional regulator GlcC [Pseudomonas fakonensis]|uniref:Transcriptional regulator GlcC n=1 Tax=Pseudomonas fakonensis TaxID=2842355 RepID=A0ABX8NDI4_9PSED|nr:MULTISPECIES: transcriptional regulator GlcC [Pseudomonas]QXH53831.1 transcriptional regulator GlcC [Pseudomonas fakonensis]